MRQKAIDIQELKEPLSSEVEEVRRGATVVILDGGEPVARILPAVSDAEVTPGIHWSGRRLSPDIPTFPVQGEKTVAEMLIEDRD